MTHSALAEYSVLLIVTVLGAWLEIRRVEVPSWLSATGVSLGIGLNFFLYGGRGLVIAVAGLSLALATYLALRSTRILTPAGLKLMVPLGAIVGPRNWMLICVLSFIASLPLAIFIALSTTELHKSGATKGMIIREFFQFLPPYQPTDGRRILHHYRVLTPHASVVAVGALFFLAMTTVWARQ